jgi:hypothetical protein
MAFSLVTNVVVFTIPCDLRHGKPIPAGPTHINLPIHSTQKAQAAREERKRRTLSAEMQSN